MGETSRSEWIGFFPADTRLHTADSITVDSEGYEVVGEPWRVRNPRLQSVSHVEANLRRTAGSADEVGS